MFMTGKRSIIIKITNSNQINIKFKNRDRLKADQVKGKPIMKGNEIAGVIDYADIYFIYGRLHNVEYSVSLEA